ncbi:MAG: cbb3-type cytochrome c oxidase subunit I [Actinomycetota bacterium]
MTNIADWLTSSDHKKIGRLFTGTALLVALWVGGVGLVAGLERMSPSSWDVIDADAAVQLLASYRFDLVLGVLAPLFIGLAVAVVPIQVGSRAIAFPRLAQFGYWTWLFGSILVGVSLVANGGPGGGQTDMVDLYLMALPLTVAGLLAAALSVVTTVLTSRAPGMTLERVPAFAWSALVGASAMLLSMPVVIGTAIYLYVDHTHAKQAFGGNKAVLDHIGFGLSQPQTFVLVVMALGVLAEVAPVASRVRQPMRPAVLAGLGLVSSGVLGAVTQSSHHLSWKGGAGDKIQSAIPWLIFNGLPLLGVLVVIGAVALAFKERAPRITAPFVFAISGVLMILVGVAGNFIATIEGADLAGTVFEEGVVVYLVAGGLLAGIGGLVHWSPKLSGRLLGGRMTALAPLGLLGTVAAAFPLYVLGFMGQPGATLAVFEIDGPVGVLNLLAGAGMAVVALVVLGTVATMLGTAAGASDDPWDAQTLEWSVPSPAPRDNFEALATVGSPEPLLDVKPQEVTA